jgi:ABC-type transporter lipoprotein component MlaA
MKTDGFRLFCLTALFLAVGLITFSSPRSVIAQDNEPVIEQSELDPWEPFNEKMFSFNHDVLDRFVIKPVALAWNAVLPDAVQIEESAIDLYAAVRNGYLQKRAAQVRAAKKAP